MQRKNKAVLLLAATFFAGFAEVSYSDSPIISQHPNDRANHHPAHESVRENQAVTTRLGANATAISYWSSASDGWHVMTTVDTVIGEDSEAEQHAIVRFSAVLAPGQEQLISVPAVLGAEQQALRIRRVGDQIQMTRISDPAI